MYAPPPAVVPVAPRRGGLAAGGPLLAICCLGFILFLIAATIILALIPVYVSRNGSSSSRSSPYTFGLNPQSAAKADSTGTVLGEGTLDSASLRNIESATEKALNLPSGSVGVTSGTSVTTTSKRKRRGFGLIRERRDGKTKTYCPFTFGRKCQKCFNLGFLRSIAPFLITVSISFLINGVIVFQGIITYLVTIILSVFTIPSLSTTSATVTKQLTG